MISEKDVWVIRLLAPGPHVWSSAPYPKNVLTSFIFSQLKSSQYNHVHITFNGLRVT